MKLLPKLLKVAAVCFVISLHIPATAETTIPLKLGWTTTDAQTDPYAIGARAFAEALSQDPNGKVFDIQFYPNRQLGDEKALIEGLRMGTAHAALITNAVTSQIEPAFLLNDLPFLYTSADQAYEILDGEVGEELAKKISSKGITLMGYMGGGFRNMINNVRPVSSPSDVAGVKYRVMQSPIYIGMYEALGGSPVPMAWSETYTAVQQGALDGLEIPLSVIDSTKSYEIAKYLSLTNHTFSVIEFLFNKRWLDKLSPEHQEAIAKAAKMAVEKQRAASEENANQLVTMLADKGMTVNEVSDMGQFRDQVKPVYEKFRPQIGTDLLDNALARVQ